LLNNPGDGPRVVAELASLGDAFLSHEMPDFAKVLYQQSLQMDNAFRPKDFGLGLNSALKGLGIDDAFKTKEAFPVGRACYGLGQCFVNDGHHDEARPYLDRAERIYRDQLGIDDRRTKEVKALLDSP